jgi:hypothetical protein
MQKDPPRDVLVSITVPLNAQEYEYLKRSATDRPPADKLASFTKWFFSRQVRGGLMIEPEDVDYLAGLNKNQRFQGSKDVVKAVEIALKREQGQYSLTVGIDPTVIGQLKETAEWMGTDTEQLLNAVVNQVLSNGWCYEFTPAMGRLIPMDEAHVEIAKRVTGKFDFNGADIAAALERLAVLEAAQPKVAAIDKGKAA